ncbi:histidine kinase [Jongsikchunia kroppenstedtii]|uniref:sensor histidine kinase n=1 Tax=Jongsikchunia kroppenstedtii TaxID=1121721 RepID=UPI00068459C2
MRIQERLALDVAPAAVIVVLILLATPHIERATAAGAVFGIIAAASLGWMRHRPIVPAVVVPAAIFGYLALDNPGGPSLLAGPVCMLALGYYARRAVLTCGVVLMIAAVMVGQLVGAGAMGGIGTAGSAWAIALALIGLTVRNRRDRVVSRRREQDLEQQQALTSERLRIARDLHDSVAHALATISVQSNVADRLTERDPAAARAAITAIRTASAEALDELGWLLNSLRDTDIDAARISAGMAGIGDLIARARANGLTLTYQESPPDSASRTPVSGPVGIAVYRVVQESLSNIVRHVGPSATASVRIDRGDDLTVTITDEGGGRPADAGDGGSTRMGIVGMRERVESTGGIFSAGPNRDAPGSRLWRDGRRAFARNDRTADDQDSRGRRPDPRPDRLSHRARAGAGLRCRRRGR